MFSVHDLFFCVILSHLVALSEHGGIAPTPPKSEKAEARREKATPLPASAPTSLIAGLLSVPKQKSAQLPPDKK